MKHLLTTAGIIDDDQVYQLVMKRTIERTGLISSVLQFYDGQEAIDFFKEKQETTGELPELILLDINMPFMNGWQFLDEFVKIDFKKGYKFTIFIVSSSSTAEDVNKAKKYGAVSGYYVKPVTKAKFEELVHSAIKAA
jgi:CheY-like chemotaxis protein